MSQGGSGGALCMDRQSVFVSNCIFEENKIIGEGEKTPTLSSLFFFFFCYFLNVRFQE